MNDDEQKILNGLVAAPGHMIWCDLETTGLDPKKDCMLEVAIVLTDKNLNELMHYHRLIKSPCSFDTLVGMMPYEVLKMHMESGLLGELNEQYKLHKDSEYRSELATPKALAEDLGQICERASIWEDHKVSRRPPLAGSTIGFDRSFLVSHLGHGWVSHYLSHRSIDVSSIRELAERWAPTVFENRPKDIEKKHRATGDVLASIDMLRYFVASGFVRGPEELVR